MAIDPRFYDAPIPGENYVNNTKNFPWHRPPEYPTYDAAMEHVIQKMLDPDDSQAFVTWIELGMTVTDVATMFCIGGVGSGKWSIDMALLIAGPVAQLLRMMARGYNVEYEMGYESKPTPTISFLRGLAELEEEGVEMLDEANNPLDELSPEGGMEAPQEEAPQEDGLMGAALGGGEFEGLMG